LLYVLITLAKIEGGHYNHKTKKIQSIERVIAR
jgi:hypothetical protein